MFTRILPVCLVFTLVFLGNDSDTLGQANVTIPKTKIAITTYDITTHSLRERHVSNSTPMTLLLTKRVIDSCAIDTTREEIKEVNAIAAILGIITKMTADRGPAACRPPQGTPEDPRINQLIDAASKTVDTTIIAVNRARASHQEVALKIDTFIKCNDARNCSATALTDTVNAVTALLSDALPVTGSAEALLASARAAVKDHEGRAGVDFYSPWLVEVRTALDCIEAKAGFLKDNLAQLKTLRENFAGFVTTANTLRVEEMVELPLRTDRNANVDYTLTCINYFTQKATISPVKFRVRYQNTPWVSVSAGVLRSNLDARQVGIQSFSVRAADGGASATRIFTETHRSNFQIIPFSFLNVRVTPVVMGVSLHASAGVGVNPNSGSNQAEYFTGGGIGFMNFFLQGGRHFGRVQQLSNGFQLGDGVPDNVGESPVQRPFEKAWGVAVSYRLPLP